MSAAIVGLLALKLYPSSLVKSIKPKEPNPTPQATTAQLKAQIAAKTPEKEIYLPTEIKIPAANLDLEVAPGVITDNKWTLYDDKVSWLTTSETLENGNVIIYGHNRIHLFGGLTKLKIGDEIIVKSDQKNFIFEVAQMRNVTPEDVDAIISDKQQLTLYTCDGSFDEKRLVIISYPKT